MQPCSLLALSSILVLPGPPAHAQCEETMSDDIRELTKADLARAISSKQRRRIVQGKIEGGEDIVALRKFAGMTQVEFSDALDISVHTLRNWKQGRRTPEGPATRCRSP